MGLIAMVQWCLGPCISYQFEMPLAVPFETLISFLLMGTLAYCAGLCIPIEREYYTKSPSFYIDNVKTYLKNKHQTVLVLFIIGAVSFIIEPGIPSSIRFIVSLFSNAMYVSILYAWFSDSKLKYWILGGGLLVILTMTFFQGMIGTLVFFIVSIGIIITLSLKLSFKFKFIGAILGLFVIMVLQSAKTLYRMETWEYSQNITEGLNREISSNPSLMWDLIIERIGDPSMLLNQESLLDFSDRLGQGNIVAKVLAQVPEVEPYANGEMTLFRPIASLVPRFIWAEKPLLPDPQNYARFTGIQLSKYNSATIGPIGEAYADYGRLGWIYLFFWGIFFKWIFVYFLKKSHERPTFFLWFVVIFIANLNSLESIIAGSFNSIFKLVIFIYFIYYFFRYAFKLRL